LTIADYQKKQKQIARYSLACQAKQAQLVRADLRAAIAQVNAIIRKGGDRAHIGAAFDVMGRSAAQRAIIEEWSKKPAAAERRLGRRFKEDIADMAGVKLPDESEPLTNRKQKNAMKKPREKETPLRVTMPAQGFAEFVRDALTGKLGTQKIGYTAEFFRRFDLSEAVWTAVKEQEGAIYNIVEGGRALGRDVKDICKDLEVMVNYGDGGKRVQGRWGNMFPNTDSGRLAAWQRNYIADNGLEWGSDAAKELLKTQDAKTWIQGRMDDKTSKGTPRLPAQVRAYVNRLGKSGLDYRAIRISRTQTQFQLSEEARSVGLDEDISTGRIEWILEPERERWACVCGEYAAESKRIGGYDAYELPVPPHPNCNCRFVPKLKSIDEVYAEFQKKFPPAGG
jgi:hypothetical protein